MRSLENSEPPLPDELQIKDNSDLLAWLMAALELALENPKNQEVIRKIKNGAENSEQK